MNSKGENVQAFVDHWKNSSKLSAGGEQKPEDPVGDSRAELASPYHLFVEFHVFCFRDGWHSKGHMIIWQI